MAMFRKKPVTVEAHQVPDPSDLQAWGELAGWLLRHDCQALLDGPDGEVGVDALLIPTLEGTMRADVGDWIIRGVQGEFYPCKPDIFEVTYEAWRGRGPSLIAAEDSRGRRPVRPLSPMVVLLSEDDGVSESQFVAVDQIAAVLPITRRNGVGITFTDGSEVHLRSGAVLRTSMKPRKVVAQMTAVLLMNEDGDQ